MKKNSFKMSNVLRNPLPIVAIVLLIALVIGSIAVNAATPTGTRLKNIQSRVLIGTEFPSNFNSMSDTSTFTSTAAAEFNMVTPENAMKWDATEPSQNSFNYGDADRLVSWAQSNGWKIHGHTLVWHSQTPNWAQNLSASALQSAMYNHIDNVMNHFKGKIMVWDVVNEAFEENGSYRASFWYNKLGKSFIENAFIRARAADSSAKLIYNDYNLEATGSKSNGAYNMLKDLKSRGIPVDGIGFQMHLDIQYNFDYNDFANNLQRFADLGLEIYITEMDVRVSSNPSSSELQTQATYYENVIKKCMAQPAVKAIQIWGFTDKYSWVPQTFPGRGAALIFDSNYNPKPSYYAVQRALETGITVTPTPTQPGPTPTPGNGSISIAAGSTSAMGSFQADQYYSGGSTYGNSNTVDVSQITSNPPPAALFNNERYGAMSYTIPGFTAGNLYEVTLYFAETYLTSSGSRRFNVSINGATVLSNFDIYASAGGQNKAIARTFTATANSSGQIVIQFTSVTENPKINGINIKPSSTNPTPTPSSTVTPTGIVNTPTPTPTGTVSISIAAGRSSALGSFQADQYYSGGSTYSNSNTVDVSQITSNSPPAALFNNERYGAMSYTIPGFTAGSLYAVTLYFAETYLSSSGSRRFNVSINGATVLSNFDIYASAGGQNRAIARSFTATANSNGQIVIQFTSVTENPKINGISIQPGTAPPTPTVGPTPTPGGTAKVMPLGDSITYGSNIAGAYRTKLWTDIRNAGKNVDFVGSQNNGPTALGDKNNEGHSGWRIDQIDSSINGWMDTYQPKIVLLHIGTNDILQNYNVSSAPSRLSALIDKICAKLPAGGKLYVAQIIPLSNSGQNQNLINFNNQIPGLVQSKVSAGKPVYVVNMYSALTTADLQEGVHPNQTGYDKMGDVWFNAISNDL